MNSVISIFGLVRSLDRDPFVVSQFSRGWCVEMGIATLERIVNRVELTEEQLAKIANAIREAEFMEITEQPEHERQEAAVPLKNKLEKIHEVHSLVRLLTPKFADSFIIRDLRRTAQLRAAYTSLAVER